MTLATITEDVAHRIFDILVDTCGQREDPDSRDSFVYGVSGERRWREYRFCGLLGYGGKVWNSYRGFYVSCYQEDKTPLREAMMEAANIRLSKLYTEVTGA